MPRKHASDEDCPICKEYMDETCSGYHNKPFIDGRTHEVMCLRCWSVPKFWYFNEETDEATVYHNFHPKRLYTVAEMVEDGFDKSEATIALKAVKALIRKWKPKPPTKREDTFDRWVVKDDPEDDLEPENEPKKADVVIKSAGAALPPPKHPRKKKHKPLLSPKHKRRKLLDKRQQLS